MFARLSSEMTEIQVDSDLRSLFAIGKIDDYEKLKKENSECWVVLSGLEARIKDRLKAFKNVSPSEVYRESVLCFDYYKFLVMLFWDISFVLSLVQINHLQEVSWWCIHHLITFLTFHWFWKKRLNNMSRTILCHGNNHISILICCALLHYLIRCLFFNFRLWR